MMLRRATEKGFTLIEMIIVLVLLGLAMAAIFPAIGNMMRSGGRTSATAQASSEADIAARMLASDVKKALGARGTGERTDTAAVGVMAATIPSLNTGSAAASDIRIASPTQLRLNADVLPTVAGIEQVDWSLLTGNNAVCGDVSRYTGTNWCIRRTVMSAAGAVITGETLTKGRGDYPTNITSCAPTPVGNPNSGTGLTAIPLRVFCYEEAVPAAGTNPADNPVGVRAGSNVTYTNMWSSTCLKRWLGDAQGPNRGAATPASRITTQHNKVDAATSIGRTDRIVTVNASIYGGGGYGKASELSYEHVSAAVRSREGEAYREAIMCGTKARWGQ